MHILIQYCNQYCKHQYETLGNELEVFINIQMHASIPWLNRIQLFSKNFFMVNWPFIDTLVL